MLSKTSKTAPRNPTADERTKIAEMLKAAKSDAEASDQTKQAYEIAATRAQASDAALNAYAAELRLACGVPAGTPMSDEDWTWRDQQGRRVVADVPRAVDAPQQDKAAEG